MTTNRKGRAGWHQLATLDISKRTCNSTGLATRFKAVIVTLALWKWLPMSMADWLIHQGEAHDE